MKEIIIESGESFTLGITYNGVTVFKTIVIGNIISYDANNMNGEIELIQTPSLEKGEIKL